MTISPGITLAIVDDNVPIRRFMASYLATSGFVISYEADNGQSLLEQLGGGDVIPDLCLLDIMMPVMDGYETAAMLKEQYPEIQILAFSSLDDQDSINRILAAGAHRFIRKDSSPIDVRDELIALQLSVYSNPPRPLYFGRSVVY